MDLREQGPGSRRHPWEVARARSLEKILRLFLSDATDKNLLDIGCGDAFVLRTVQDSFGFRRADGVDVNLTETQTHQFSRERPDIRLWNNYSNLSQYDVVLMLDVVEHVKTDKEFIQGIAGRHLSNDGVLLITVPAFQFLFSTHDRYLGHYRRYTRHEIITLVENDLEVLAGGYLFSTLLPIRLLTCMYEKLFQRNGVLKKGVGRWNGGHVISGFAAWFITFENSLLIALSRRNIYIPGLSVWIICKKRAS